MGICTHTEREDIRMKVMSGGSNVISVIRQPQGLKIIQGASYVKITAEHIPDLLQAILKQSTSEENH